MTRFLRCSTRRAPSWRERDQAAAFLSEQGVDFPTYIKTGDDMAFITAFDPKWSGALPANFLFDAQGRQRHALLGKSSYAQFEAQVLDGMTFREISESTGISQDTLSARKRYAIARMAAALREWI